MIRATASSITPTLFRARRRGGALLFAATCAAGGATAAYCAVAAAPQRDRDRRGDHRDPAVARCSSSSDGSHSEGATRRRTRRPPATDSAAPTSPSSRRMADFNVDFGGIERGASLVLPTLEAMVRAGRLASTAAAMAVDYQVHFLRRKHPDSIANQVYTWVFCNDDGQRNSGRGKKMQELERTVDRLEKDLENAQHEYVAPTVESESARNNTTPPSKQKKKQAMLDIANELANVQEELSSLEQGGNAAANSVHKRNAQRLLQLFRDNGGVYIKVGQHLANLDLLLPEEYIESLSSLFDDAPVSSYSDVCRVVEEELGSSPNDVFDDFSEEPLASASLAQVHTAKCKRTGRKLAVKVQHRGLRETSRGDILALSTVVGVAERLFDEFNLGWICEEMTPQLPRELDFNNEGRNAEAAADHLRGTGLDCVVPRVLWDSTSHRVLTMEFEEGFRATDIEAIEKAGICKRETAKLISSVFNAQIFDNGFVHCDPHEANVLLREHPVKKGKPQIVLVDHGLYKTLDADFQEAYARLWKGIVMADIPEIRSSCELLGVTEMWTLLSSMLTSRPFDEVVERSRTRSLEAKPSGNGDRAVIKGYAQKYIKEIIAMLDIVPRQMLLIFKMNDCLRHVDMSLGSPVNNLVVAGRYASKRVYESDVQKHRRSNGGIQCLLRSWLSYFNVLIRINSYELLSRFFAK